MKDTVQESKEQSNWQFAAKKADLLAKKTLKVRVLQKQVVLFATKNGIRACDNRCPHEGYPLSEGSVSGNCVLTCNWHNWKFDLETGDNLFGGDRLRTYQIEERGEEIWIDMQEPPFAQQYSDAIENLRYAFDHDSYDQIARECARLQLIGADPMDALRKSIDWSWQKLEFGWTHAYAGMADWLQLYDENSGDQEIRLTCILEPVSHVAYDVLRERDYPFTDKALPFDREEFLEAVESENEDYAIALIAGGLKDGMQFEDFESTLSYSALAHYNDFGHSLIYVDKAKQLVKHLGNEMLKPLLFSLVRGFIYATREDRIPEFRNYAKALNKWGQGDGSEPLASNWYRQSINRALEVTVACSHAHSEEIYQQLLLANAISMLGFDIDQQSKVRTTIAENVGWLDFTHGITFSNAVKKQCRLFPELWPKGLLQMACFIGRNAAYTTKTYDITQWQVENIENAFEDIIDQVFAHGIGEHIVSVHLLKTALAVREEVNDLSEPDAMQLVASLNRFIRSPLKRRIPRRVAYQSLKFIGSDSD